VAADTGPAPTGEFAASSPSRARPFPATGESVRPSAGVRRQTRTYHAIPTEYPGLIKVSHLLHHSTIYLFIAGTYAPVSVVLLPGRLRAVMLVFVRTARTMGYAGVQMGFVIALLLVAPPAREGELAPTVGRMERVAVGLGITLLVTSLWPGFPAAPPEPAR
jgi:hypothetical protein